MNEGNNIDVVYRVLDQIYNDEWNLGRVRVTKKEYYYLFNYTAQAQFAGDFTNVEMACRGLVIRNDFTIMALPMPKFFNLGEPQSPPIPFKMPYKIYEKIDGTLGIFWHDGKGWRCNTRGSFDNPYTRFALKWWEDNNWRKHFTPNQTVMCEIKIDNDEMPRAAKRAEGLYLLAIRNRNNGDNVPIEDYEHELPKPRTVNVSIDYLIKHKDSDVTEGLEGWVILFENGLRIKIKTHWYLNVFRAMQSMTPRRIRDLMLEREDWLEQFPDDVQPEARIIGNKIKTQHGELLSMIHYAYEKVKDIKTQKDFALYVNQHHKDIAHWLFKLRATRFCEKDVLEKINIF